MSRAPMIAKFAELHREQSHQKQAQALELRFNVSEQKTVLNLGEFFFLWERMSSRCAISHRLSQRSKSATRRRSRPTMWAGLYGRICPLAQAELVRLRKIAPCAVGIDDEGAMVLGQLFANRK
jgi:hypothetical protein